MGDLLSPMKHNDEQITHEDRNNLFFRFAAGNSLAFAGLSTSTNGEDHLPLWNIGFHHHMVAMMDLAFQNLQRQRVLDHALDRPLQRTSAIRRS